MSDQSLSESDVRHIAKLARLHLSDGQLHAITPQLGAVIDYVRQLSRVDVTNVEPMTHAVRVQNVLRDDEVQPAMSLENVLLNAPETDGPFFKVPKIIGGSEDNDA